MNESEMQEVAKLRSKAILVAMLHQAMYIFNVDQSRAHGIASTTPSICFETQHLQAPAPSAQV